MFWKTRLRLALIALGSVAAPVWAATGGWQEAYEQIRDGIRTRPGEAPWRAIPWQTDLRDAQRLSAAEGKPIFVWSMAGEPLGCA